MKIKLNTFLAALLLVALSAGKIYAQHPVFNLYHVFDKDSLSGFDEEAARSSAISEQFLGDEFKVRMYQLKRNYINDKYALVKKKPRGGYEPFFMYEAKPTVQPGCVNEDFEASTNGVITASNQILGWTVTKGSNSGSGNNSCNLNGCCPTQPTASALFVAPNGYIDPVIGNIYPIFSVFGTSQGDPNAEANNPQIAQGMFGDNFIRINNSTNDYSIEKLSKTFSVTSSNALFQFAFISVFNTGHGCCDAGAFQIRLINATTNSVIACPNFSASALSSACTNTNNNITYLNAVTGTSANTSSSVIFNKWQVSSMDLSQYIGQNITIEIVSTDCTAGGHYGYVYFDAQCGPMVIYGNGNPYDAGTSNVTVPTCGAAGATICAVAGLGPYSWAGPNIPISYATPSYTNGCFISSVSATYTLYMSPAGACTPIARVVTSTITPAPLINGSVVQAQCGQTLAVVSVTPGGSASTPSNVTWSPFPSIGLNTSATSGTYIIPSSVPAAVTITATDPLGCKVATTVSVNPAPPYPTFTIASTNNSYSVTCFNPVVTLTANTNYTYGSLNYFWQGSSQTSSASAANVTLPGTYTCYVNDPVTNCAATHTVAVFVNTTTPLSSITPTYQTITCTAPIQNATITANNPTINVSNTILSPYGGTTSVFGTQMIYPLTGVGVYTAITSNDINGCITQKTFTVFSLQGYPTFSFNSAPGGFTLGCGTKSAAVINITGAQTTSVDPTTSVVVPLGASPTYTILNPTSTGTLPGGNLNPIPTFTVNTAGLYTLVVRDNSNGCDTRVPVSVIQNTAGPTIDNLIVPRNILTCDTNNVVLQAISSLTTATYVWQFPGVPSQVSTSTVVVNTNTLAPTTTVIATYTAILTDPNNTCKTTTTVAIYQNLFPPKPGISTSSPLISCKVPSVTLTGQNSATSPTGGIFPPGIAVASAWYGPTPQVPVFLSSTYVGSQPGTYTMVAKDVRNGCTASTVITIGDNISYPKINENLNFTIPPVDCGANTVITPTVFPTSDMTYSWTAPDGAPTSPKDKKTLTVQQPGDYRLTVTNTLTGCFTSTLFEVQANTTMTPQISADVVTGFAPLRVNFTNLSATSTESVNINSVWNFGNSTSFSATVNGTTTALYTHPGIYTVTVYATKGNCVGVTTQTISVEVPSKLEIPNIFTPNGDGVNDIYFLNIANLSNIQATIYDRWGHKVYEIDTESESNNAGGKQNVNISWDGKNQLGKEVPEGTYFYVIKATGKDGVEYNNKGTINLVR